MIFQTNEINIYVLPHQAYLQKRYEELNNVKLRRSNITHRHEKYDWLVANIDRDIVGQKKGLEIKNVGWRTAHLWGEDGTDQAAEHYLPQPHHYMLVLDYDAYDLSAVIGGQELRTYAFERDKEMDQLIIEATHDFWHNHVLKETPPELDFTHKYVKDTLKRVYNCVTGEVVNLDDKAQAWATVMLDAAEKRSEYEKIEEGAKNHILSLVGNAGLGILPNGTGFTRKTVKRKAFSVESTEYIQLRHTKKL